MIASFRRHAKKYAWALYAIAIILALPASFTWFISGFSSRNVPEIATVNGKKIEMSSFRKIFSELHNQISMIKSYARMYGFSDELFIKNMLGGKNPDQIAFDRCVNDLLLDQLAEQLSVEMDRDLFKEQLVATMPKEMIDEQGSFNMEAYQAHLHKLSLSPQEFEKAQEKEFKRDIALDLLAHGLYTPEKSKNDEEMKEKGIKSFEYMRVPFGELLASQEKSSVSESDLADFYQRIQEKYRTTEKRTISLWKMPLKEFEKNVSVDEKAVQRFYEKNKSSLYRVKPQVKVRRLLFDKKIDEKEQQKILQQAKDKPTEFSNLIKKYSGDEKNSTTELFSRGTFSDKSFESAAFKLKEPLEISELIKTEKGTEIIQLVERINAQEKSFDQVKDEITASMLAKRSINEVKATMERLIKEAKKGNQAAMQQQIKEWASHKKEAKTFSSDDLKKIGNEGDLAQKTFSLKKEQPFGYLIEGGELTIIELSDIHKSQIQPVKDVIDQVKKEYYQEKAEEKAQALKTEIAAQLLEGKEPLEKIAEALRYEYKKVKDVKKRTTSQQLADFQNASSLFSLNDSKQLMVTRAKNKDLVFVRLTEQNFDEKNNSKRKRSIENGKSEKQSKPFALSIIASLKKNAKIDKNEEALKQFSQK